MEEIMQLKNNSIIIVASVVAFLFTEKASAINGSTIPVEDGFQIFKNS
jgi:hypothetical protein